MLDPRSCAFRNLADARRQFRPGQRVLITNYRHPWLSFEGIIRRNQAKEFALDCPRRGPGWLTWQQWPKATDFDPTNGDVYALVREAGSAESYPVGQAVRTRIFTFTRLD